MCGNIFTDLLFSPHLLGKLLHKKKIASYTLSNPYRAHVCDDKTQGKFRNVYKAFHVEFCAWNIYNRTKNTRHYESIRFRRA